MILYSPYLLEVQGELLHLLEEGEGEEQVLQEGEEQVLQEGEEQVLQEGEEEEEEGEEEEHQEEEEVEEEEAAVVRSVHKNDVTMATYVHTHR